MRIIGGQARGRRLKAGRDLSIRPTSDKVRESIFDILESGGTGAAFLSPLHNKGGCNVLDLFAGTGALGVESLSRGATGATFVDSRREAIILIRENLKDAGFSDRSQIMKLNLPDGLKRLSVEANTRFNLVFMDPPYGKGLVDDTLRELEGLDLVAADAIIVAEHSSREDVQEHFELFKLIRRKVYSTTAVSFYERA